MIDSLGVGSAPDAIAYHDEGSDTLGHIDAVVSSLHIPNLTRLGLANLHPLTHWHSGLTQHTIVKLMPML